MGNVVVDFVLVINTLLFFIAAFLIKSVSGFSVLAISGILFTLFVIGLHK